MSRFETHKQQVVETCQKLSHSGLLIGSGGNISVRIADEELFAITPSGMAYDGMQAEDICIVNWDGEVIEGEHKASIEKAMHAAIYQNRLDVNAVIHTHQPYASVFAVINEPIPALFDEQVLNLGKLVEVVHYGPSGTPKLKNNLVSKLKNQCNAYILQNHGAICTGRDIETTIKNVLLLEKCAKVYTYALSTGCKVHQLNPVMKEVIGVMQKKNVRKAVKEKTG
jgi:ribulose-5-phosphate 4-epimerase/fuculose-1-phosphate aldolase